MVTPNDYKPDWEWACAFLTDFRDFAVRLPPEVRQTVKTLFAVR